MQFSWDAANISHIARHHVTPEEAEQVVENKPLDLERQFRKGEERVLHLGETAAGRILFVVVTVRDTLLRVVTAHPADRKTRKFYAIQKEVRRGQDSRNA